MESLKKITGRSLSKINIEDNNKFVKSKVNTQNNIK